jgi:pimeloyl-ACP methyl ester carboxylesterase
MNASRPPATLVLIPGMLNTPAVFDRMQRSWQALPWPEGPPPRCVVVDVREPVGIEEMAAAAWEAVATLPAAAPLLLAGYSMGGYVALQMLATAPRPVQGLALVCTSARADTPEGAAVRERAIAAVERDFDRYVGTLVSFMLTPSAQQDAALVADVRADMRAVGPVVAVRQHRAAAARADRREFVRQLQLPVQVLGAADDKVTPPALSQELAQLAPRAELELIEGSGHLVPFEHPQRLAAALQRLAQRASAHENR